MITITLYKKLLPCVIGCVVLSLAGVGVVHAYDDQKKETSIFSFALSSFKPQKILRSSINEAQERENEKREVCMLARLTPHVVQSILAKKLKVSFSNISKEKSDILHLLAIRLHDDIMLFNHAVEKKIVPTTESLELLKEDVSTYAKLVNNEEELADFFGTEGVIPVVVSIQQMIDRSFQRRIDVLKALSNNI